MGSPQDGIKTTLSPPPPVSKQRWKNTVHDQLTAEQSTVGKHILGVLMHPAPSS